MKTAPVKFDLVARDDGCINVELCADDKHLIDWIMTPEQAENFAARLVNKALVVRKLTNRWD